MPVIGHFESSTTPLTPRIFAILCLLLASSFSAFAGEPAPAATTAPAAPVYDESADASKDVAAAIQLAARENKRVLLDIGGNWCGWCRLLHELFTGNADIQALLRAEYEVVYVDIAHGDKNQDLLKTYGIKPDGYPYLAVLDADNKLVTQQKTDALEDGPSHDPKKVTEFLTKWQAPALDARKSLDAALAKASADGKRVFLRFGAPWCGWCHKLDDVLYQPAVDAALRADLVVLKVDVDRMTGGKDLQKKYQTSEGIPWFAVLTPDASVVGSSDITPGNNIGFPTEPAEIDHVMKLLTAGRKHATDEQVAAVRDAFTKAAAVVKQGQAH